MTADGRAAIDAKVDAAFPGLREGLQATLLPERHAQALGLLPLGERSVQSPQEIAQVQRLQADLRTIISEIGKWQTGAPVDPHWVRDAATKLGQAATGVVGWSLEHENIPEALDVVIKLAKEQLKDDMRAFGGGGADCPF